DKTTFFMSLITPLILLILFITFLKDVYIESLKSGLPDGVVLDSSVINAFAGGWLMSSIVGVICITIAFCSNLIMVNDKINGNIRDFYITPTSKELISVGYFVANYLTTLLICLITVAISFIYLAIVGFFLSFGDCVLIIVNVMLCCLLGSLLASIVERFINSQGGISAVATLVSSVYGFICGAYMPISQFNSVIQNIVVFNPGTYNVILFRNYYLNGVLDKIGETTGVEVVAGLRDAFDGNLYFFGTQVSEGAMYAVCVTSIVVLCVAFVLLTKFLKQNGGKVKVKTVKQKND
ncbi:MAG: ABC transporter permease, partial [Christensenellales bacterium]